MATSHGVTVGGYFCPQVPITKVDEKDEKTPDDWIPRHPELIRLTGRHPFNCEPPLKELANHGFITPTSLHYVRNHGPPPKLAWDTHRIRIGGAVNNPVELSMNDLLTNFERVTMPVTLVCAGNRRKEQNMHKQGIGFSWGAAGLSTSVWTGVRLRDVLDHCGIKSWSDGAKHVCMGGADYLPGGGGSYYATSITRHVAMDWDSHNVILAWEQNGEKLTPDHGYPIRVVIPGYIGGRMIKWLTDITVSEQEDSSHYHYHDNRVLPPGIDADRAIAERWWYKPEYIINDLNINSAITSPGHDEVVTVQPGRVGTYKCKGYAYSGGGRKVTRVELSFDEGVTWELCTLTHPEQPTPAGKHWCWCFWEFDVEFMCLLRSKQMMVRAWDTGLNTQPMNFTWNVMGMMNNCTFKVRIHDLEEPAVPGGLSLQFEHPTQAGQLPGGWMVPKQVEEKTAGRANEAKPAAAQVAPAGGKKPDTRYFTAEEVAKHTEKEDCWFIYNGKVYDATSYMDDHPGGAESILLVAGEDATEEFDSLHSEKARKMLEGYCIGELSADGRSHPEPASPSLYLKLGGEQAIHQVVEKFYTDRVMKDSSLSPIFDNKDMKTIRNHARLFLEFVLGGPKEYTGRTMEEAHAGLGITEDHWNAVCSHLLATLQEMGANEEDIGEVMNLVGSLKSKIIDPLSSLSISAPAKLTTMKPMTSNKHTPTPNPMNGVYSSIAPVADTRRGSIAPVSEVPFKKAVPEIQKPVAKSGLTNLMDSFKKVVQPDNKATEEDKEAQRPKALHKRKKVAFALVEREELSYNVRRLRFALQSPDHILGLPVGQHMFISGRVNGAMCMRAYTPLTGDEVQGYFDLLIKVYYKNEHPKFPEGGKMSQHLNDLSLGQTIDVRGPLGHIDYQGRGKFLMDGKPRFAKHIRMMAGGTGITPMWQVMQAVMRDPEDTTELSLIYANNTETDIMLYKELNEMRENNANCRVYHTLASPKEPELWREGTGFINEDMVRENIGEPVEDALVFLCGPPPMLNFACIPALMALGYQKDNIFQF